MEGKYTVRSVLNDPTKENEHPKKKLTPLEQAKKWAMEYLKRPHSEKELRDRLTQKGCSEEDIQTVTKLCVDYGFLDDGEYACMIVRHYSGKGYGPQRIKLELRRRGVDLEYWEQALEEMPEGTETIDHLLAVKLQGRDIHDRKDCDRAVAALARRGFSWDDINAALNRLRGRED